MADTGRPTTRTVGSDRAGPRLGSSERFVLVQDRLVELLELSTRVDPEGLHQLLPSSLINVERLGLPS